jgi:phosphatidylglycerol---prolipoprotein diacylglyceryl transferase
MHPILFHIGSYAVHSFGVMLMIAFAASVLRAYRATIRIAPESPAAGGVPEPADVLDVGAWMILAGVIGARLMFVIIDWPDYRGHPGSWFALWEGGISFHGGLVGGLIAMAIYTKRRGISIVKLGDLLAPSVMLGYAIGRIGCFLNGCCYGGPTSMPWGVVFHDDGRVTPPSHPTQIYASLMSFAFLGVLIWLERNKSFDGQIIGWYLILASVERFVMEIWRAGYTSTVVAAGLTDVQFLCMALIAVGGCWLVVFRRRKPVAHPSQSPPVVVVAP